MKFKTDKFGDRSLQFTDDDGDKLEVIAGTDIYRTTITINGGSTVALHRKEARKLAKEILRETEK